MSLLINFLLTNFYCTVDLNDLYVHIDGQSFFFLSRCAKCYKWLEILNVLCVLRLYNVKKHIIYYCVLSTFYVEEQGQHYQVAQPPQFQTPLFLRCLFLFFLLRHFPLRSSRKSRKSSAQEMCWVKEDLDVFITGSWKMELRLL